MYEKKSTMYIVRPLNFTQNLKSSQKILKIFNKLYEKYDNNFFLISII